MDVAIPKLRSGSYFPDWLLQCRKRAEPALTSVVATCSYWECRPAGWSDSSNPWA
jgi:transposase-like protein